MKKETNITYRARFTRNSLKSFFFSTPKRSQGKILNETHLSQCLIDFPPLGQLCVYDDDFNVDERRESVSVAAAIRRTFKLTDCNYDNNSMFAVNSATVN